MHLSNNEIVCIGQVQLLFPEMFWPDNASAAAYDGLSCIAPSIGL